MQRLRLKQKQKQNLKKKKEYSMRFEIIEEKKDKHMESSCKNCYVLCINISTHFAKLSSCP